MSTSPIPVLLFGKSGSHVDAVVKTVQPEFEIIKVASDVEAAKQAVAGYFIGSSAAAQKPQIIVMGGGFPQEDFEAVIAVSSLARPSLEGGAGANESQVTWLRPNYFASGASGPPPLSSYPPAQPIADRIRKCLLEHMDVWKANGGKGDLYYF